MIMDGIALSIVRGALSRHYDSALHARKDMLETDIQVKIS